MEEAKKKRGRQPSGVKHTTLILPQELRDELRKIADQLELRTGEKYSLHRTVNHLTIFYLAVTEAPDGE